MCEIGTTYDVFQSLWFYSWTEPEFIVILWELKQATAWGNLSSDMGLPMLHEMSI